jgi:cell wall-associated NlpC family hydrolase
MPLWLAKLGIQLAMDPEKLVRIIVGAGIVLVLIVVMVFAAPIMFFTHVPLGKSSQDFNYYQAAVRQIQQETNVKVNWQQMMAIDAVIFEQDFTKASQAHAYSYKKYFIREEKVKVEETCQRPVKKTINGKKVIVQEDYDCSYYRTEYYARAWDDVLNMLVADRIITTDQIEDVKRYMTLDLESVLLTAQGGSLTTDVLALEPIVRKYAKMYKIEDKVALLLALIQQESGGRIPDVMQSSESAGLPRNTFTNPEQSIAQGVMYFSQMLTKARGDEKLALQAYNFGTGFIDYANSRGGYSKEVAVAFSNQQAQMLGWNSYGDVDYVDHVMKYFSAILTSGDQIFDVNQVYQEMRKYLGTPYLLGARDPNTGFVDCSGLMEYVFGKFGINIKGTAQDQFNMTTPVLPSAAQPGDLVFFYTGGDRTITHVGMYIGNDKFINANSKGVVESSISTWSNYTDSSGIKYIFYGYHRITS